MKKIMLSLFSLLLLCSITAAQPGSVTAPADDVEIEIQVSPSTILLYWTHRGEGEGHGAHGRQLLQRFHFGATVDIGRGVGFLRLFRRPGEPGGKVRTTRRSPTW